MRSAWRLRACISRWMVCGTMIRATTSRLGSVVLTSFRPRVAAVSVCAHITAPAVCLTFQTITLLRLFETWTTCGFFNNKCFVLYPRECYYKTIYSYYFFTGALIIVFKRGFWNLNGDFIFNKITSWHFYVNWFYLKRIVN